MRSFLLLLHLLSLVHVWPESEAQPSQEAFPDDVVELTRALVDIPSPSGHEQDAFAYVHRWLSANNFTVLEQAVPPLSPAHESRSNLLAHLPAVSPSSLSIVFATHLDTVPGTVEANAQFSASRLYGRGSVDAKGQAAAMLLATARLRHPTVGILLVCGEETDHAGMLAAHQLGLSNFTMVNGEPTENHVALRQKGMIKARLSAHGHAVHSGYPHLGHSAIHALLDVLHAIRRRDWGDGVTVNVGVISGGQAPNVVADKADAMVMWRIMSTAAPILSEIRKLVAQHERVEMELITENDAMEFHVPPMASTVGNTTVAYNTDVPYYKGYLFRAVLFGAGSIHQAHTEDEYIEVKELRRLPDLHAQIARDLMKDLQDEEACRVDSA